MSPVPLSATVKKIAKDFALDDGHFRMTAKKMKGWIATLEKLEAAERPRTVQELIALAIKFEREGGATAAQGAAQLYLFAAGLMDKKEKPAAKKSWGAKK